MRELSHTQYVRCPVLQKQKFPLYFRGKWVQLCQRKIEKSRTYYQLEYVLGYKVEMTQNISEWCRYDTAQINDTEFFFRKN